MALQMMMMAVVTFVITAIKSGKTLSCAIATTFLVCHMRGTILINEDEEEDHPHDIDHDDHHCDENEDHDHDPNQSDDDHDDK